MGYWISYAETLEQMSNNITNYFKQKSCQSSIAMIEAFYYTVDISYKDYYKYW